MKNIVIVHGAVADGLGWRKAADILEDHGINVTIVQQPVTSLADKVAADLSQDKTAFLAKSQIFVAKGVLAAKISNPVWKTKKAG